jgi:hypothetical protein
MCLRRSEEIYRLKRDRCKICDQISKKRKEERFNKNKEALAEFGLDSETRFDLRKLRQHLLENSKDLEPEFAAILEDHFWDLLA